MKNKWNTMERDWWKYWFSTLLQCHSRAQPACERCIVLIPRTLGTSEHLTLLMRGFESLIKRWATYGLGGKPLAAAPHGNFKFAVSSCFMFIYIKGKKIRLFDTSSTAQGGGGSFKNRKPIGEVGCCESGMAERSHWWTERCLISLTLSISFSDYLPTYLSIFYVSIYLSIYLSISLSLSFI